MIELFDSLTHWHWFGLAGGLLGARALMPFGTAYTTGRAVLALGLGAAVVGLALLVDPMLPGLQQLGLAVLAVFAARYGLNRWAGRDYRRAEHLLDQVFTLSQAIVAGTGRLDIDGESWLVRGGDLPSGARIKVVGISESVRIAELDRAGAGPGAFNPGAPVQVVGTELALEVEKA